MKGSPVCGVSISKGSCHLSIQTGGKGLLCMYISSSLQSVHVCVVHTYKAPVVIIAVVAVSIASFCM